MSFNRFSPPPAINNSTLSDIQLSAIQIKNRYKSPYSGGLQINIDNNTTLIDFKKTPFTYILATPSENIEVDIINAPPVGFNFVCENTGQGSIILTINSLNPTSIQDDDTTYFTTSANNESDGQKLILRNPPN